MFEGISQKLNKTLKKVRGYGKLSEDNIQDSLREIRLSLLEADVNFAVTREFINSVKERAVGSEVAQSLTPGQQFVKIVHQELIKVLGESSSEINLNVPPPVVIMLIGLQGSGKTTSSSKLARYLAESKKKKPLLVPADVYRPAAIEQLKVLGKSIEVPVFDTSPGADPVDICLNARKSAELNGNDVVIIDTAGRLHIDQELMNELISIKSSLEPSEILLVADAMTGQDAVNTSKNFNESLQIDGVILTKMDGDARGGAALSIKSVTGSPIKFFGTGEKLDALEVFHPDRIASRILGMGDVLTLIEKTQNVFEEKKAEQMAKKIQKKQFSLEDFKESIMAMNKLGSLENITSMLPLKNNVAIDPGMMKTAESDLKKSIAIINSMTFKERKNHTILNGKRRQRIAKGSGTKVQDVNKLIKNYMQMQKMMKNMGRTGKLAKKFMKYM